MTSRVEQTAVEGHAERRILAVPMRQAYGRTRVTSPRQLPTDHDYDGVPLTRSIREYQSDQPSIQLPRPTPGPHRTKRDGGPLA
jgi:hypothetical protein